MKIDLEPINELKYARDQLALESFSVASVSGFLSDLLPGILSSFKGTDDIVELPVYASLNKDQTKFLKLLKDVPYTEIGELRAFVPEGMCKSYLEYLDYLLHVTQYIKTIQGEVIQPYTLFLAKLMSDKQGMVTSEDKKNEYAALEKHRDSVYAEFSKFYTVDSFKAESKVKSVIDRNADWTTVFSKLNTCNENVKAIDLNLIKRQVQQCVGYLELIYDGLKKDTVKDTSKEAAARLSNGAFQCAKELELLSTTYYRVLAINGSIENTVKFITKVVG